MRLSPLYRRFGLLFTLGSLAISCQAVTSSTPHSKPSRDEAQLHALARRINQETLGLGRSSHIDILAEEFHTPLSVIEEARQKGNDWGKITIELAMAQQLSAQDPAHYATTADALFDVARLQTEHKTWRGLARSLHISLQPVKRFVARSYQNQLTSGRTEHAGL